MKIKVKNSTYEEVCSLPKPKVKKPDRQSALARTILYLASLSEIRAVNFSYEEIGMNRLGKEEPALFLMNHSSFTDLMIASKMLRNRQYHIVTTNDGFIGKEALMRFIGCIPTKKFITDMTLVKDMQYTFKELNSSILMFPEASYSFDGSTTPLPKSLGKFIKIMNIPVVIISTKGAFLRDQADRNIKITECFRADGLHRPLYKCPNCLCEGTMEGKVISIKCRNCSFEAELEEDGTLKYITPSSDTSEKPINHSFVTDWYAWERECVRKELLDGTYHMEMDVDILMLADSRCMYRVGEGRLTHSSDGFHLTGCDGKLTYIQKPKASYSLYSDYFWYEIGDMISIGDSRYQYYCFPKNQEAAIVAKARLATEELYKLS